MKRILILLPLFAAFSLTAPAETDETTRTTLLNDDPRGTGEGEVRVFPNGRAGLRGFLHNEDGSVRGQVQAILLLNGNMIAVASTPEVTVLVGTWTELGFEAATTSGAEVEMSGTFDETFSMWTGEWRHRLD